MGKVYVDISMSLDGFVAGPNPSLENPLGEGGERLHEWTTGLASWRERHGRGGGAEDADSELVAEAIAGNGAVVMGRKMFSGGEGPWEKDANAEGWWQDADPPFRMPVFVLTHHERDDVSKPGGTTFRFVTEGIEAAVERAQAAAGGKDVVVAGGASVVQQALTSGVVDELHIHLAPLLLGSGTRLLDESSAGVELELDRVVTSPAVTHLRYRVAK
jgi:dihydrofolate reductase